MIFPFMKIAPKKGSQIVILIKEVSCDIYDDEKSAKCQFIYCSLKIFSCACNNLLTAGLPHVFYEQIFRGGIDENSDTRENNNDLTNMPTTVMAKKFEFRG